MRSVVRVLCGLLLLATPAWAQVLEQPKRVTFLLAVIDIASIEGSSQAVDIDFILRMSWKDPVEAHEEEGVVGRRLSDVWNPRVQIANGAKLKQLRPAFVEIEPDGTVTYRQRYVGPLVQRFDFSDFPRDRQRIKVEIVSGMTSPEVEFVADDRTGRLDDLSIPDWRIGAAELTVEERVLLGDPHPSFRLEFDAVRLVDFYLWKVILPLAMIIFMSWSVFWISPTQAGSQISISATSILTLIAYRFALGKTVPALPYLTRLDEFIFGSSVLVFLALVEVIVTASLAESEKVAQAVRIDRYCRAIFPILFALLVVKSFWY